MLGKSLTVNICSGESYSIREVISICKKITGHKIKIKINDNLKRKLDSPNIIGNPYKLNSIIGNYKFTKLEKTLEWMLSNN